MKLSSHHCPYIYIRFIFSSITLETVLKLFGFLFLLFATAAALICYGDEGAQPKDKALDLPAGLRSHPYMYERMRSWIWEWEINWFHALLEMYWGAQTSRLRVEHLLFHIKRSHLNGLRHLVQIPPGHIPREVFKEAKGTPQGCWTISLAWSSFSLPYRRWKRCLRRGKTGVSAETAAPTTHLPRSSKGWQLLFVSGFTNKKIMFYSLDLVNFKLNVQSISIND